MSTIRAQVTGKISGATQTSLTQMLLKLVEIDNSKAELLDEDVLPGYTQITLELKVKKPKALPGIRFEEVDNDGHGTYTFEVRAKDNDIAKLVKEHFPKYTCSWDEDEGWTFITK